MTQIISDEEITLIVRECAKGSAINRDGSTSHRIARAIEASILAKLNSAEPVMVVPYAVAVNAVGYVGSANYQSREDEAIRLIDESEFKAYLHPPAPSAEEVFNQSESDQTLHACISFVIHGDADFYGMDVGLVDYFKKAVIAARSGE